MIYRKLTEPHNPNRIGIFVLSETDEERKIVERKIKEIQDEISTLYNITFKEIKPDAIETPNQEKNETDET